MTAPVTDGLIHFGRFDDRACSNSQRRTRQITLDPNEVTCADCKSRDRLWLSPQGRAAVAAYTSGSPRSSEDLP